MKNLLLSSLDVDFYFSWFLVTKSVAEMEEKLYLRGISGFCLFTRVRGMPENMVGPNFRFYFNENFGFYPF